MDTQLIKHIKNREILFRSSPVLIAAWPGFGNVGLVSAEYIRRKTEAKPLGTIDTKQFYTPQSAVVKGGKIKPARIPSSAFHYTLSPDLLIYESSVNLGPREEIFILQTLIDIAKKHGVKQIITIAAIPAPMSNFQPPELLFAANNDRLFGQFKEMGVKPLIEGEIPGPSGILPSMADSAGIEAACLMVTMPAYAGGTIYPKAAVSVIELISEMIDFPFDMSEVKNLTEKLDVQFRAIEEKFKAKLFDTSAEENIEGFGEYEDRTPEPAKREEDEIAPEIKGRIESLFNLVKVDRSKATELKAELDKFGLFKKYEDRFLDLFL
ncbi:Uncharacterized protein (ATP-grasp superfamily) [Chitinispirillum alkaliphilum]|nr:Uncharacterized protein (ATP-grasp superfamily) [Chitinispirillum alkaliphilum]